MAAIAAVALTVTVVVARRAVSSASETVVRGEGQTLTLEIQADLAAADLRDAAGRGPEVGAALESILGARSAEGLRGLEIVFQGGEVVARAGSLRVPGGKIADGDLVSASGVVRLATRIQPPKIDVAHPPGPPPFAGGPPFFGPPPPGGPFGGPFLVIEFEPPMIAKLRTDADLTVVVAAVAGLALVGFALGWSRSLSRVARYEQRAEAERRLVALGRMSSVMAHELRNPLASLKGHAQLLAEQVADEGVSDRVRAKVERVISEAERLELLTNSLLEFVRDRPLEITAVSAQSLVDEALLDLPHDRIRVDLDRATVDLHVDRVRAARALHNLLHNAIEESPEDAPVEVRVESERDGVTIEVRDHGRGIRPGAEQSIFEPFVTTRVRGTGLGLPIARRIAEQHGGTLVGATHPDGGAVFRLRLPAAPTR